MLRAGDRKVMAKGDAREHRVRQLARLFDVDPPPNPHLWTASHHERMAGTLISPGVPVLAIGPAANWPAKQWRARRYSRVAPRPAPPSPPPPRNRRPRPAPPPSPPPAQPPLTGPPP